MKMSDSHQPKSQKRRLIEALVKIEEYHQRNPEFSICIICREHFSGTPYGNTTTPIRKHGKCCDKCNHDKVIPARMGEKTNPFGSWELQQLQRKMDTVIRHFSKHWKKVVDEDAVLYYMYKDFRELVTEEGRGWKIKKMEE